MKKVTYGIVTHGGVRTTTPSYGNDLVKKDIKAVWKVKILEDTGKNYIVKHIKKLAGEAQFGSAYLDARSAIISKEDVDEVYEVTEYSLIDKIKKWFNC